MTAVKGIISNITFAPIVGCDAHIASRKFDEKYFRRKNFVASLLRVVKRRDGSE